jgi:Tfp pilus assembly protein PilX
VRAPRGSRRGAALPLALFIIVIVTILAAGAFMMMGSERRVADNTDAQLDAYVMATRGMERFIVGRASLGFTAEPPAAVESTTIAMPGGYVDVVMRQVKPGLATAVPATYVIRARGVKTLGSTIVAERTVAQYAAFDYGSPRIGAAWTAMGGLTTTGSSATVSGVDACSVAPTVGGVAVPTVPGFTGASTVPTGSPNIVDLGTAAQTTAAVEVDWNAIINGTAMIPDVTVSGSTGWPTSTDWSNANFWPVIRANGDLDLPSDGRGTLIVTGNMRINGSQKWNGIVLVGGALTSNGNNTVLGAVITGLNAKLGMTVSQSDLGTGNKTYQYSSCDVANATRRFKKLVPYRNAGADNVPVY